MMRQTMMIVALSVGVLIGDLACWAETPEQLYRQMYGQSETMVRRSRAFDDDLEFANKLLTASGQLRENPKFAAYLCEQAAQMAARHVEGIDLAVQAQRKRMEIDETQTGDALDQIVLLRERAYRMARGGDRDRAGAVLLNELVSVARQREKAGEYTDASRLYRKASGIARVIASPQQASIQDQADRANDLAGAQRRLGILKDRLARDASDAAAHREIALLYLSDLGNLSAAIKHAEQAGDEPLQAIAELHRRGVGQLSDDEALKLAEWCHQQAGNATISNVGKVNLLQQAKLAYQKYLSVHTAGDVARLRANTALSRVTEQLAQLKPGRIGHIPVRDTTSTSATPSNSGAQSAKGTIYAAGDYHLTLCVNGKQICSGSYSTLSSASVELKDGDVISAKVDYYDEDFYDGTLGFWCMFIAEDGRRNSFMTNPRDWYIYTPTDRSNWAKVNLDARHAHAQLARPFPIKLAQVIQGAPNINSAEVLRGAMLWGPARGSDTYFYHVVDIK